MFETDRILMTAVDTGWITDERPHQEKLRIAAEGWHAPLDLVDGAARVYDPIVRGEAGRTCSAASSRTTSRPPGEPQEPVTAWPRLARLSWSWASVTSGKLIFFSSASSVTLLQS